MGKLMVIGQLSGIEEYVVVDESDVGGSILTVEAQIFNVAEDELEPQKIILGNLLRFMGPVEPVEPPIPLEELEAKGGSGSGNWGHRGRPGKRGGSAPGGGFNRLESRYGVTARDGASSAPTPTLKPKPDPKPTPKPAPAAWRPAMTRQEALDWSAESALSQDFVHITSKDNVRGIEAKGFPASYIDSIIKGFDLSKRRFGRVWGDGVYMSDNPETQEMYREWAGKGAATVILRVNVKNPYVLDEKKENPSGSWEFSSNRVVRKHVEAKIGRKITDEESNGFDTMLQLAGYDAFHLIPARGPTDGSSGGDQFIIFNPKNVVVVKGA